MKYFLKYFRNQKLKNGDEIRLELHKAYPDDYQFYPLARPIADVLTGLRLDIEGGMDDIDTPIIKTSFSFSVVDAPENNDPSVNGPKWGDWEEFYTADATGWKVVLLGRKTYESDFRTLWSGYVTPDSYTETLQYHGVVSITARDNIGHLQDFEFDARGNAEGMITPYELINQAWAKIASPMTLEWRGVEDSTYWPQTGGVDAIYTYLNVSAFEGKSWYEAVSDTLYSLGLVMRYVGRNRVAVCPLRLMPAYTEEALDDLPQITPQFVAYGTRELVPAVKEITEEVKYEIEEGAEQPLVQDEDFTGDALSCPIEMKDEFGGMETGSAQVNPISNEGELGWGNIKANTLFMRPSIYRSELPDYQATREQLFLAACTKNRMVWYGRNVRMEGDIVVKVTRGNLIGKVGNILTEAGPQKTVSLTITLKRTIDGVEEYYTGDKWAPTYQTRTMTFDENGEAEIIIHSEGAQGVGLLQLFITGVGVDWLFGYPEKAVNGVYLGIKSLVITHPQTRSLMAKNKVTTKYDEAFNVILSRTPALGPAYDYVAVPQIISNGIFRKENGAYVPTTEWAWPYGIDTAPLQLAAQVHKQLLMFHSKTNNLLSGTIVNADMLNPRALWVWKGKPHLLLSGSYNFLNGQLEGATLREFVRYEELWG